MSVYEMSNGNNGTFMRHGRARGAGLARAVFFSSSFSMAGPIQFGVSYPQKRLMNPSTKVSVGVLFLKLVERKARAFQTRFSSAFLLTDDTFLSFVFHGT